VRFIAANLKKGEDNFPFSLRAPRLPFTVICVAFAVKMESSGPLGKIS